MQNAVSLFSVTTGFGFTFTITVSLVTQLPFVAVMMYCVVSFGEAEGFNVFALESPVVGLHEKPVWLAIDVPRITEPPLQKLVSVRVETIGFGTLVMETESIALHPCKEVTVT